MRSAWKVAQGAITGIRICELSAFLLGPRGRTGSMKDRERFGFPSMQDDRFIRAVPTDKRLPTMLLQINNVTTKAIRVLNFWASGVCYSLRFDLCGRCLCYSEDETRVMDSESKTCFTSYIQTYQGDGCADCCC